MYSEVCGIIPETSSQVTNQHFYNRIISSISSSGK